jgi:hypothetical protein
LLIEIYQQKEAKLKEYDKDIEKIENDIKYNQEMGRQVIEYYITADVGMDMIASNEIETLDEDINMANIDESDDDIKIKIKNVKKTKSKQLIDLDEECC